jgi:hypothetical protein
MLTLLLQEQKAFQLNCWAGKQTVKAAETPKASEGGDEKTTVGANGQQANRRPR